MERIIIKKGSEITEYENNRLISTQDLDNTDNPENFMGMQITKYNRVLIDYLYEDVLNAKTKKDFSNIATNFIKCYLKTDLNPENRTKYQKMFANKKNINVQKIISTIIQKHIYNKLNKIDRGTNYYNIANLETLKFEGAPISELFDMAEINYQTNANNPELQALINKTFLDIIDIMFYKKVTNKCFDCKLGHPNTCIKIEDMPKEHISEYPFIENGQQLINGDEMTKFVVTKCKKYIKEPNPSPYRRTYNI